MFNSKVYLIRSEECLEEDFSQVVNLLKQFNGPIEFISAETNYLQSTPPVVSWMTKLEFEKKNTPKLSLYEIDLPACFSASDSEPPQASIVFPVEVPSLSWDTLFDACIDLRNKNNIPENDHVIILTDFANIENWFAGIDATMKNYFIQTSNWHHYLGNSIDSRFPIAYEIVVWLLRSQMFKNRQEIMNSVHKGSSGCMMDFCENKKEIVLKMRTADICNDCLKVIQIKEVDRPFARQVLDTMDGIRQHMMFRERSEFLNSPSKMEIRGFMKRIFLKDLGDLEMQLNPKEKTIYLFFLKHPEGVRIVDLIDHKTEISHFYETFTNSYDTSQIEQAINLLLDPTEGNINQVFSRIRAKFKSAVGTRLSNLYTIEGNPGEPFKINLNRELVSIEDYNN
ncbi:MAG: hypothetical protein NTY55_12860 [Flavobacteriia bacterium]|nr:hypothetical protein [Flavobacteriia bacterium]